MNIVIEKLQKMVEDKGTQKAVADELGISCQYLNDIIRERSTISEYIANKLGCTWVLVEKTDGQDS